MAPREYSIMFRSARQHPLRLAFAPAACIPLVETLSSLHFAVASRYVLVIAPSAQDLRRRGIILIGVSCAALTVASYLLMHGFSLYGPAPLRSAVSFRGFSASERLAEVQRSAQIRRASSRQRPLTSSFKSIMMSQIYAYRTVLVASAGCDLTSHRACRRRTS
jgi:hypothetical protein